MILDTWADEDDQERRVQLEATPAERIAQLEQRKELLVTKRNGLQRKIDELQEKLARRQAECDDHDAKG